MKETQNSTRKEKTTRNSQNGDTSPLADNANNFFSFFFSLFQNPPCLDDQSQIPPNKNHKYTYKILIVFRANTSTQERAVMIKPFSTPVTFLAVVTFSRDR